VKIKKKKHFKCAGATRSLRTSALVTQNSSSDTAVLSRQTERLFYITTSYFKLRFKDGFTFKPTMFVDGGVTPLFR